MPQETGQRTRRVKDLALLAHLTLLRLHRRKGVVFVNGKADMLFPGAPPPCGKCPSNAIASLRIYHRFQVGRFHNISMTRENHGRLRFFIPQKPCA